MSRGLADAGFQPEKAAKLLDRLSLQLGGRPPRDLLASESSARRVQELLAQVDNDNRLHPRRTQV